MTVPYVRWKPVDKLDTFVMDSLKVWCAIDFAYQDDEGKLRIIDWKTGAEKPDALKIQLACYAIYAGMEWGVPASKIRNFGCFLGDNARMSEYPITNELIAEARDIILTSAAEMKECLLDPHSNLAREEDFPFCDNERLCSYCNYRGACARFVE
jgi:RecB family exonuclease